MRTRILDVIRQIPRGQVSTYGAVARAAGLPRGARMVVRALHGAVDVPWQRVLGAGGEIKLRGESGFEQRFRLQAEGVTFRGRRVDMKTHEHQFSGGRRKGKVKVVRGKTFTAKGAKARKSGRKLIAKRSKQSAERR